MFWSSWTVNHFQSSCLLERDVWIGHRCPTSPVPCSSRIAGYSAVAAWASKPFAVVPELYSVPLQWASKDQSCNTCIQSNVCYAATQAMQVFMGSTVAACTVEWGWHQPSQPHSRRRQRLGRVIRIPCKDWRQKLSRPGTCSHPPEQRLLAPDLPPKREENDRCCLRFWNLHLLSDILYHFVPSRSTNLRQTPQDQQQCVMC